MPDKRIDHAIAMAHEAGKLALEFQADPERMKIREKGHLDLVTAADHAVEDLLRKRISGFDPKSAILGEEAGLAGGAGATWILDPIDGTVNYSRGMPDWAISIAFYDGRELACGVIHAPALGLTAHATRGGAAFINGVAVRMDGATAQAPIVSLGYSPRSSLSDYLSRIEKLLAEGVEHRRHGAATIGLLGVLAGWFDAYFEPRLNVWDAAAGLVLIEAAGGVVRHDPMKQFLKGPSDVFVHNGMGANVIAALGLSDTAG